jgi:putative Holliday junction resolvase
MGRILAIDPGIRRVGLALSDPGRHVATPLEVLPNNRDLFKRLRLIIDEQDVDLIVVGRPRSLGGELGEQAHFSERFAEEVKSATTLPVELEDETSTTELAKERQQGANLPLDAIAAQIILEGYLARN